MLAASEKAVLRLEDLADCITDEVEWSHGLLAGPPSRSGTGDACAVVVLSYPRYCRYRALLKRLEGCWPPEGSLAMLLGTDLGLSRSGATCRLLFCRDTFEHEALAHSDLICDHLGGWQGRWQHLRGEGRLFTASRAGLSSWANITESCS